MAFLDSKTKFSMSNSNAKEPIRATDFFKWSNSNMYRTSTHDMGKAKVLDIMVLIACIGVGSGVKTVSYNPGLCGVQTWHCGQ